MEFTRIISKMGDDLIIKVPRRLHQVFSRGSTVRVELVSNKYCNVKCSNCGSFIKGLSYRSKITGKPLCYKCYTNECVNKKDNGGVEKCSS